MAEAHSRATSMGRPMSGLDSPQNHVQNPGYKVQLEQVTAKKRKLKITNTHTTQPPTGYTFLAVGYADLAERCKEISRMRGVEVRLVSAADKNVAVDKVSTYLHRIGYHFNNDVFDEACDQLGYRLKDGKLIRDADTLPANDFERVMARFGANFGQIRRKTATAEEETKVKKAIKELFPKIPDDALHEIFRTAWREGARTVGHAATLPLSRRVQLATIAHIRHTYTEYDRLLRMVTWADARRIVEPRCLEKLIEWRGDNEEPGDDVENIVRETIVLDDEGPYGTDEEHSSDNSYKIVSQSYAHGYDAGESSEGQPFKTEYPGQPFQSSAPEMTYQVPVQAAWQQIPIPYDSREPLMPIYSAVGPPTAQPEEIVQIHINTDGRLPRKIIQDGVEYVRISPDRDVPDPRSHIGHSDHGSYSTRPTSSFYHDQAYYTVPSHQPEPLFAPSHSSQAYTTPLHAESHPQQIIQSIETAHEDVPHRARTDSWVPSASQLRKRQHSEVESSESSDYEPPGIAEVARRNDPRGDAAPIKRSRYHHQSSSGSASSDGQYDPANPMAGLNSADRNIPAKHANQSRVMHDQYHGGDDRRQAYRNHAVHQPQHGAPSAVQPKANPGSACGQYTAGWPQYTQQPTTVQHPYAMQPSAPQYPYAAAPQPGYSSTPQIHGGNSYTRR